jgi:hypothetical protein
MAVVQIHCAETATIMAQLADDYDKLADQAEARTKDTPKTH